MKKRLAPAANDAALRLYFAVRGAGNSASWKLLISQRPFCFVTTTIIRPFRTGASDPSFSLVPVITVSASTSAISA